MRRLFPILLAAAACGCLANYDRKEGDAWQAYKDRKYGTCVALYTDALKEYDQLQRSRGPASPERQEGREGEARAYLGRARCWRAGGRIDDAVADLEQAYRRFADLADEEVSGPEQARRKRELADLRLDLGEWRREQARR